MKNESFGISIGRKKRGAIQKGPAPKFRQFSESLAFTVGLLFVIFYFTTLLLGAGDGGKVKAEDEAVTVFNEMTDDVSNDHRLAEDDSIWDKLERCLEDVFLDKGESGD